MAEEIPESTARAEDGGSAATFTPFQRVLAGISLAALLASAAISSWWILDGRADFANAPGGSPQSVEDAPEARTPPDRLKH
jgi:hypothetical protein